MNERRGEGPGSDGPAGGWPRVDSSLGEGPASEDPMRTAADGTRPPGEGAAGRPAQGSDSTPGTEEHPEHWKRRALEDFRQWLDALADTPPPDDEDEDEEPEG